MLISEAFAQAAGGVPAGAFDNLGQFLPLVLIWSLTGSHSMRAVRPMGPKARRVRW